MWDSKSQEQAHADGWGFVTTINNRDSHPYYDIVRHGGKFLTDRDAALGVIGAAKRGSVFHQRALKIFMDSRVRTSKGKK